MFFKFVRRYGWLSAGTGLLLALMPISMVNAASTSTHGVFLADSNGNKDGNGPGKPTSAPGPGPGPGPGKPTSAPETPYSVLFPIAIAGGALWVYRKRRVTQDS